MKFKKKFKRGQAVGINYRGFRFIGKYIAFHKDEEAQHEVGFPMPSGDGRLRIESCNFYDKEVS